MKHLLAAVAVGAVGVAALAIAGAPGCGSSCTGAGCGVTVDTFVHWTLVAHQQSWFNETPGGVGAKLVKLDFNGPTTFSVTVDSSFAQAKVSSLEPGHYSVTGTLLDVAMNPLTKGLASVQFDTTGANQDVVIDFPYEDFIQSYTGTYYFNATWGGATTCAAAVPPVVKQRLILSRGGVPVPGMTITGDKLDGTTLLPCQDALSDQAAPGLTWGPATLTVIGEDGSAHVLFQGTFPTFVGADLANPTMNVDVPSSDAGVHD